MTPTILILFLGLGVLLVGVGLLGTLVGIRAAQASFGNLETGLVMAGYYAGYIVGTRLTPGLILHVGHVRVFAAFAAVCAASALAFGLLVGPWWWLALRALNGLCVVGLYMVVESWLNAQSSGASRGRVFSAYMTSTLLALGAAQYLLLVPDPSGLHLFSLAAILVCLGVVPIALNRLDEPSIDIAEPLSLRALIGISPLGTAGSAVAGILSGAFWGMLPLFGQRLELDPGEIALLMSATIFGGALLQWPVGLASDRFDRRAVLIAAATASALLAGVSAWLVLGGRAGIGISSFVYGGLMFALYSLSVAHCNDHLAPSQVLGATEGLLLVYGIGAFCGPLLGGVAMELAGPVGLPAMAMAAALSLAIYGLYRVTRRAAPGSGEKVAFVPLVRTTPVVLDMMPDADPEQAREAPAP